MTSYSSSFLKHLLIFLTAMITVKYEIIGGQLTERPIMVDIILRANANEK